MTQALPDLPFRAVGSDLGDLRSRRCRLDRCVEVIRVGRSMPLRGRGPMCEANQSNPPSTTIAFQVRLACRALSLPQRLGPLRP